MPRKGYKPQAGRTRGMPEKIAAQHFNRRISPAEVQILHAAGFGSKTDGTQIIGRCYIPGSPDEKLEEHHDRQLNSYDWVHCFLMVRCFDRAQFLERDQPGIKFLLHTVRTAPGKSLRG